MDTLKLLQEALRLAQEAQKPTGVSDAVLIAIITGAVGLATIYLNARSEARAEKVKTAAAAEAEKIRISAAAEATRVNTKLAEVEIKIDGRLSELLEAYRREGELKEIKGHKEGMQQERQEEKDRRHEAPPAQATPTVLHDAAPLKLTITEGEMKVVPETTPKKKK